MSRKQHQNLNTVKRGQDGYGRPIPAKFYAPGSPKVWVYTDKLALHLSQWIRKHDGTAACFAWLSDKTVIRALQDTECSIIVNKEKEYRDFSGDESTYYPISSRFGDLLTRPAGIGYGSGAEGTPARILAGCNVFSYRQGYDWAAIRCVGPENLYSDPTVRMHNKYAVFYDRSQCDGCTKTWHCRDCRKGFRLNRADCKECGGLTDCEDCGCCQGCGKDVILPKAVWTGSYNPTYMSANSLENAVVIQSEAVATKYLEDFEIIAYKSLPLEWGQGGTVLQYGVA